MKEKPISYAWKRRLAVATGFKLTEYRVPMHFEGVEPKIILQDEYCSEFDKPQIIW